jgi:hypothetical protein
MAHTIPYDLGIMDGYRQGGPPRPSGGPPSRLRPWSSTARKSDHPGPRPPRPAPPERRAPTLEGVSHASVVMAPKRLVPTLERFFGA